jgi:hypothetical protein
MVADTDIVNDAFVARVDAQTRVAPCMRDSKQIEGGSPDDNRDGSSASVL